VAPRVDVEVRLGAVLSCFNIVGLPATEVRESKERARTALVNSGFDFPGERITVNLAPADLSKDYGRFDLAIPVGILVASRQLAPRHDLPVLELLDELGLAAICVRCRGPCPLPARREIGPYSGGKPAQSALISRPRRRFARRLCLARRARVRVCRPPHHT